MHIYITVAVASLYDIGIKVLDNKYIHKTYFASSSVFVDQVLKHLQSTKCARPTKHTCNYS